MAAPKPNALSWLGVSALVIVLDQLSKAWVLRALPEYTDIVVIPGFWNWFRTYNTGAAFSFLANSGGWQIWFFSILAFAISGAVQHTAGLGHPAHVVSVNVDPHCPMMTMADLAVVADARATLDELLTLLGPAGHEGGGREDG